MTFTRNLGDRSLQKISFPPTGQNYFFRFPLPPFTIIKDVYFFLNHKNILFQKLTRGTTWKGYKLPSDVPYLTITLWHEFYLPFDLSYVETDSIKHTNPPPGPDSNDRAKSVLAPNQVALLVDPSRWLITSDGRDWERTRVTFTELPRGVGPPVFLVVLHALKAEFTFVF